VASYVLLENDEMSIRIEECRRMQPARRLEEPLRLPELLRQRVDRLRSHLRTGRYHRTAAQLQLLQARFAAYTTGARRVEVALQRAQIVGEVAAELHVHDVVLLLGVEVGIHAVADLEDVVERGDDPLPVQKPGGELEVRSRSPHG